MANSAEAIVAAALSPLAGARVFPDVAPAATVRPYIVYQAVGGQDSNTLGGPTNLQNARVQVAVWADTRATAVALMRNSISALVGEPIKALPIGSPVSVHEPETKLYGSRQDVSIWFIP